MADIIVSRRYLCRVIDHWGRQNAQGGSVQGGNVQGGNIQGGNVQRGNVQGGNVLDPKRDGLDTSDLSNYRSIASMPFLSKKQGA